MLFVAQDLLTKFSLLVNQKLKGDDVVKTVTIPISLYMKNELDKLREKDETYEDVILRLIVNLENAEVMLRSFIEKSS